MHSLRAATAGDRDFLHALFCALRGPELAQAGLDGPQLQALLHMQFEAQDQGYRTAWPQARSSIILVGSAAVGRMVVAQDAAALRLVDIALLPLWRGRGIGSALLRALQQEAGAARLPLRLQVVSNNPAEALYRRLGFQETGVSGVHRVMQWENEND